MSEFTSGTLFLTRDVPVLQAHLHTLKLTHLITTVNARWSGLLTADEYLLHDETLSAILALSHHLPLLHFSNAEDHGWSTCLFHQGEEKASYSVTYEGGDILEDLFPEEGPAEPVLADADEVRHFQVFDLSPDRIAALQVLLTQPPDPEDQWAQVEAFRRLLDLEEMSWVSYRHALHDRHSG